MLRLRRFRENRHTRFGNVVILLFLLAQAADGVLTYLGVHVYGLRAEGNPLMLWLMTTLGEGPALATAKLTAASLGSWLHVMTVHRLVAILTAIYVAGALVPWAVLLFVPLRHLGMF
jgi:uncharacterized membrane protein